MLLHHSKKDDELDELINLILQTYFEFKRDMK